MHMTSNIALIGVAHSACPSTQPSGLINAQSQNDSCPFGGGGGGSAGGVHYSGPSEASRDVE
jgi:hypothetical protein